jgi:hypothetical protein
MEKNPKCDWNVTIVVSLHCALVMMHIVVDKASINPLQSTLAVCLPVRMTYVLCVVEVLGPRCVRHRCFRTAALPPVSTQVHHRSLPSSLQHPACQP